MRQCFKIAAVVMGIALSAASALADYQAGMEAYRMRHYKWALKEFKSDQSRESQYSLGVMYFKGEGVKADPLEGIEWFRKAADQGHAQAQFLLGIIYYSGKDVPVDRIAAIKWYRKAAEQGHLQAQVNLGMLYLNGEGVAKDRNKGVLWLKKAARSGNRDASVLLKSMGEEVPVLLPPLGGKSTKRPLTPGAPFVVPPGHPQ